MTEIAIIDRNPNAADPYSGEPENLYASPQEVYDRLSEMADEMENNLYDMLPNELIEKIQEDEYISEVFNQSRFFYYKDRAYALLENFNDLDSDLRFMELALYQADKGEYSGYDTTEIIQQALFYEDVAKSVSFKSLFCKYIFDGDKFYSKKYKEFTEELYEILHDYDKKATYDSVESEILKLYQQYFNSGETLNYSGVMNIKQNVNHLFHAIADKVSKLDLRIYLSAFIQSRELCMNFDRYLQEMQMTVALHEDLKLFYKQKELALEMQYAEKIKELEARNKALLMFNEEGKVHDNPELLEV